MNKQHNIQNTNNILSVPQLNGLPLIVAVVDYPTPSKGWGQGQKTMEPQKLSNSPEPGPKIVQKRRVAKEQAVQNVRSWTVQNEMRGAVGRVSAGASGRIVNSANPRVIRA